MRIKTIYKKNTWTYFSHEKKITIISVKLESHAHLKNINLIVCSQSIRFISVLAGSFCVTPNSYGIEIWHICHKSALTVHFTCTVRFTYISHFYFLMSRQYDMSISRRAFPGKHNFHLTLIVLVFVCKKPYDFFRGRGWLKLHLLCVEFY